MVQTRILLIVATALIYLATIAAAYTSGLNWPAVAFADLIAINWRSQFNFDFIVHLLLMALWINWREGFGTRGYLFGCLSIVMGGMFSFPYLAHAIYRSDHDPIQLLLGQHYKKSLHTNQGKARCAKK